MMVKHKRIKCHVMTMYDWLKRNHPEDITEDGSTLYCPWILSYSLIDSYGYDCDNGSCEDCWNRPFRGVEDG